MDFSSNCTSEDSNQDLSPLNSSNPVAWSTILFLGEEESIKTYKSLQKQTETHVFLRRRRRSRNPRRCFREQRQKLRRVGGSRCVHRRWMQVKPLFGNRLLLLRWASKRRWGWRFVEQRVIIQRRNRAESKGREIKDARRENLSVAWRKPTGRGEIRD